LSSKTRRDNRTIVLGPLPVDSINRVLGLELEAGQLILKSAAQVHAANRHPEEYPVILPCLPEVLSSALYVGDDHGNAGKIELIGRIRELDQFILIAVIIEVDPNGFYSVASFYPVSQTKIQGRREKGFLVRLV
jgi:phage-Barnase-EndoU-ColicinE5/D-RelE like nuclease3